MDYRKHYDKLIDTRKELRMGVGIYESHHIIPRSLGGNNEKNNLILLTPREHYVAHLLLSRMFDGLNKKKMVFALWMMSNRLKYDISIVSSRQYQSVKEAVSIARKGFRYTDDSKQKMSRSAKARKGNRTLSETTKQKISIAMMGDNNPSRKYGPWNKGKTGIKGTFNRKSIIQFDINTGEIVRVWESMSYAANELNIKISQISTVCNGKRNKSAGGFGWRFE
jgi:hypothetical protein